MHVKNKAAFVAMASIVVLASFMAFGVCADVRNTGDNGSKAIPGNGLVSFSSEDDLREALENLDAVNDSLNDYYNKRYPPIYYDYPVMEEAAPQADATENSSPSTGNKPENEYSQTNVQVQGVDEGDIVKTDGTYVYQIINNEVAIGKLYPVDEMNLVGKISLSGSEFTPSELYVDGDRLIVIGTSYQYYYEGYSEYGPSSSGYTRVLIYDISSKADPYFLKQMDLEGSYLSSRKVGTMFYCVTNKPYYSYETKDLDSVRPHYRVGSDKADYVAVPLENMGYFKNTVYRNFMTVGAIDVVNTSDYNVYSYLGSGDVMYMSQNNLFVASTLMDIVWTKPVVNGEPGEIKDIGGVETEVYKFNLAGASIEYGATGRVEGSVLNQWSMDEYNGNFRISTTNHSADWWWWSPEETKNNIFVLDSNMDTIGKLTGLAPGEEIYSTLFIGKRVYLVTFRQVDPFFVIDLSNPEKPKVLGKLKIPGFSNYLYPYDEDHIIGFGQETTDQYGGVITTGMKVGLFDVSDVDNPWQVSAVEIGARGTTSELLNNHKALFFNRDTGLMAFPVTLMEVTNPDPDYPEWGTFAYQGAYFYKVDLVNGITFQYRLTHLSDADLTEADQYYYDDSKYINRILYINDIIYTVSDEFWMANSLNNFTQLGMISTDGVPVKPPVTSTPGAIKVVVNGSLLNLDTPAIFTNGRVMVPVRAIFEALGAQLQWNGSDESILATSGIKTILMKVGSTEALINGVAVTMEVPPTMEGDRVLVPLRFVAESLGATVSWDDATQTVTIDK